MSKNLSVNEITKKGKKWAKWSLKSLLWVWLACLGLANQ
jgi:hypothetical protein